MLNPPKVQPHGGVPLGGIGCGSIGRGFRGNFNRWSILNSSIVENNEVPLDAFSVRIFRPTTGVQATVLYPKDASGPKVPSWNYGMTGGKYFGGKIKSQDNSHYFGLFPKAWTVYQEPDPSIRLICKQMSPVIAHNYKESSFPVVSFVLVFFSFPEHFYVGNREFRRI